MGKGFALLGLSKSGGLAGVVSKDESRLHLRAGIECMRRAKALAEESGEVEQAAFAQQMIDRAQEGGIDAAQEAVMSSMSTCSTDTEEAHCSHAVVARSAAATEPDPEGWLPSEEEVLVALVARDGVGDWQSKADELLTRRIQDTMSVKHVMNTTGTMVEAKVALSPTELETRPARFTVESLSRKWASLAPRVREELQEQDRTRACGHSCGTCPTRSSCHLHEAVDMEDMFSGSATRA